jgi:DNA-binding NarL/FixJ family response regulator
MNRATPTPGGEATRSAPTQMPAHGSVAAPTLTPQQRRVLRLIAKGRSTKQMAHDLAISERTAQWHVTRLMQLLNAPNRPAVVYEAGRRGLLRS